MFQAEGTAEAQAVRQDRYWRVQGAALRTLAYGMEQRGRRGAREEQESEWLAGA